MTLGEIKIEALKLMFTNYEQDIKASEIDELKLDETFGSYLVNMNEAINRAINRFMLKGVLAVKKVIYDHTQGDLGTFLTRYDMAEVADYYKIVKVSKESGRRYIGNIDFMSEGSDIVLPTLEAGEKYIIEYVPRATRITDTTEEDTEIALPEEMASMIPYYIKAELYEEDEPEIAAVSRNIFEQFIIELQAERTTHYQARVERVFRYEN